jgi:hypothetical protein
MMRMMMMMMKSYDGYDNRGCNNGCNFVCDVLMSSKSKTNTTTGKTMLHGHSIPFNNELNFQPTRSEQSI